MQVRNYKKFVTAALYAIQVPLGVLAGYELGAQNFFLGVAITGLLMVIEVFAVTMWMDAQTAEIRMHRKRRR
ncbi:MAG: hypothetical protein M1474_03285 [Candidatus Marsarchaeota archaeon]|nr:hypothetical protein [Candidatus Marsarchaeota archaeon]